MMLTNRKYLEKVLEKNNKREKTKRKQREKQEEKKKRSSPTISNPRPENVKGNVMRLRIYRAHACTESYLNRDEEARIMI